MALVVTVSGASDIQQGEQLSLSAGVTENGQSPLGTLSYAWSADRGSFIGATDQSTATYQADFTDSNDVDVTITCAVTRPAESNPSISAAHLQAMTQLGIDGQVLNIYITDTSGSAEGSWTVLWSTSHTNSSIDGNSDTDIAGDLPVNRIRWRTDNDLIVIHDGGAGSLSDYFTNNTDKSLFVIFSNGTYYEFTNSDLDGSGGSYARWSVTDAAAQTAFDGLGSDGALVVGIADTGSVGWAADSGDGTATFSASSNALTFGSETIADQTWTVGIAVNITLPEATGGGATKTYTLTPTLPSGIMFNATTRVLSGLPNMDFANDTFTYSCSDGTDTVSLMFDAQVRFPETDLLQMTQLPEANYTDGLFPVAIQNPDLTTQALGHILNHTNLMTLIVAGVEALTGDNRLDGSTLRNTISNADQLLNLLFGFTDIQKRNTRRDLEVPQGQIRSVYNNDSFSLASGNDSPIALIYVKNANTNEVWIVDNDDNIYRYALDRSFIGSSPLQTGHNQSPRAGAYVASEDEVWIVENQSGDKLFYRYNPDTRGSAGSSYNAGTTTSVVGMCYNPVTTEVLAVMFNRTIRRYNPSNGNYIDDVNLHADNDFPESIAYIPEIGIVVFDRSNDRAYTYNASTLAFESVERLTYNADENPTGADYIEDLKQYWLVDSISDNVYVHDLEYVTDSVDGGSFSGDQLTLTKPSGNDIVISGAPEGLTEANVLALFQMFGEENQQQIRDSISAVSGVPGISFVDTIDSVSNPVGATYVSTENEIWILSLRTSPPHQIIRYNESVQLISGNYTLNSANVNARSITFISSISEVWVGDANNNLYRYNPSNGNYIGSYSTGFTLPNRQPWGLGYDSDNDQVLITDRVDIYKFSTSGTQIGSAYTLDSANTGPRGLTYISGTGIVVVDINADAIFIYDDSIDLQQRNDLHPDDNNPEGIAYVSALGELWTVSNVNNNAFRYRLEPVLSPENLLLIMREFDTIQQGVARTALAALGAATVTADNNGSGEAAGDIVVVRRSNTYIVGTSITLQAGDTAFIIDFS